MQWLRSGAFAFSSESSPHEFSWPLVVCHALPMRRLGAASSCPVLTRAAQEAEKEENEGRVG
eukprot:1459016-Pyramimonas_sp.AAC.1